MKDTSKKVVALGLSALMLAGFAGCGNSDKGEAASGDTIKIGVNYELTGDVAQYGLTSAAGIEMAINEVNEAGGVLGKQVEIVKIDNKSDNNEAMTVATKLASEEKVVAMLGPATSGAFKATNSIANEYKIPAVSGSATADDVTVNEDGSVNEYMFRVCFNDSYQGEVMAKFAKDTLKANKVVILSDKADAYSNGLATAFETSYKEAGGTVASKENYTTADTDFSSVLTKVKSVKCDAIYLPAYYQQASLIIKQARDLGINVPFLGPDGYDSAEMVETAGAEALNKVYFTNHYSAEDESVQDFIKAYKDANNGDDPSAFSALGYDIGKFVCDAIERAGEPTAEKIKEAMASTKDFKGGVTGAFSIDEKHNPVKSTVVIEFKDGKQTFNSRVDAE